MPKLSTETLEITRSQADIILFCIEQMFIDLSDSEVEDLTPIINKLSKIVE
jgi:hypothetical protein